MMRAPLMVFALVFIAALGVVGCGSKTPHADVPTQDLSVRVADVPTGPLPKDVRPLHYAIGLTILPSEERFSGRTRIRVVLDEPRIGIWLHGRNLAVTRATVTPEGADPVSAEWEQLGEDGIAVLRFQRLVPAGEAVVDIEYTAPFSAGLDGLYRVQAAGEHYAFTQFEAISARDVFPGFDEPAFKTPFDIAITAKSEHVAVANTLPVAQESAGEGLTRTRYATTEKLPTYLLAFAVGALEVVDAPPLAPTKVRSRTVPFRGIAVKGQGAKLQYALEQTPQIVEALERYFGTEYPYDKLDIVAVPDFAAGAMENAGLVTFREWLLLVDGESAPEQQRRAMASVMAHELAHQWFGNLVTMPWWDDIWLNEAFATWMAAKIIAELYPEHGADLSLREWVQGAMAQDSLTAARQIRQPIESNHDISNAFDSITYSKGAAVLGMFERWIGVEVFREGIRAYMDKHRFGTATYEDLLGALGTAAERDVATPFSSFLFQPGVPFLETELQCDGAPVVRVSQSRYLPVGSTGESDRTWQVPVCVRYGTGKTEGKTHCELITETTAEIKLPETTCPGWISPNADGVGYYRFGLATKDWEALQSVAFSGLSGLERLAIVDSLQAAFWNGSAEAKDVLEGLGPIAKDPERRVAEEPMSLLGVASKHLVHAKALPAFEAFAARLYAPRAKELGWDAAAGESGDAKLERASVLSFLALTAKDPKVRKEAEKRGHAVVSAKGQSAEVVPAELVSTVLTVALQEGDMAFFDGVVELALSSEDTILRSNFLSAIGRVTAPDMAAKVRELVFDPRVRTNEIRLLVSSQSRASETRDAFWKWFVDNWDRYVERITKDAAGGTPYMAAGFCSESDAAAVEAFFKDRIDDLRGGPRNLAAVLEGIRICAAMVDKQAAGVTAFFEKK